MSLAAAPTFQQYEGAPEVPEQLPKIVSPAALVRMKVRAGALVGLATDVVNSGERVPAVNVLTPPPPDPQVAKAHADPV
jgi:hypothetical protein